MGIIESSFSVFVKLGFRFEIFVPQALKIFLNRKLKEYKGSGVISDYEVKTKRIGKYHYFLEMDLFLNTTNGGEILWLKRRKDA